MSESKKETIDFYFNVLISHRSNFSELIIIFICYHSLFLTDRHIVV
ncbi:hypothetical protein XBKQ1_2930025 [Xenorhabdus bovienii str. kraussei Quebec]|uniref:Uncharacterized protein n=1 Tax=Xenorhabdus bovienii str. kraussei Quebec TaxID=1398203 RepID=A0A077PJI6_XENBV|nr:hypothetical protein XBKQ1_2930025 [Xenorhabdus bovienii str. kraussei Quebec]